MPWIVIKGDSSQANTDKDKDMTQVLGEKTESRELLNLAPSKYILGIWKRLLRRSTNG